MNSKNEVIYLDLFAGIGGFALGAYWSGFKADKHYFSEIDPFCIELYQLRFPSAIPLGDIKMINANNLPQGDWIITGGFPCQDISTAGEGEGIYGERSGLWFEMWRLIRDLRPRFAIIENVRAITFRGLSDVLSSLAEIGYDAEWQDIQASDLGYPHRRERIWVVAYPHGAGWERILCCNIKDCSKKEEQKATLDISSNPFLQFEKRMGEPAVFGVDNGIPRQVDRLRALGNAIVPQIAELLFKKILKLMRD